MSMVMHGGNTLGFSTHISFLPSANIGLFLSTTTGQHNVAPFIIAMYIKDILLEEEPWLNLTTACTFPKPWVTDAMSHHEELILDRLDKLWHPMDKTLPKHVQPNKFHRHNPKQTQYVGTYGNFIYGNITLYENEQDTLMLKYGQLGLWELEYLGIEGKFFAHGHGDMWPVNIELIQFWSSVPGSDVIDVVELLIDMDPPVFVRDLQMADAYPPPDPGHCP